MFEILRGTPHGWLGGHGAAEVHRYLGLARLLDLAALGQVGPNVAGAAAIKNCVTASGKGPE